MGLCAQTEPIQTGMTYKFLLSVGRTMYARVLSIDSAAMYVLEANDTDPQFVPVHQIVRYSQVAERRNLLTLDPLSFVSDFFVVPITYYRRLDDHWMVGGGPRYYRPSDRFGFLLDARYFTAGNAPRGFYVGPNAGFVPKLPYPYEGEFDAITAGVVFGWDWSLSYNLTIGFGISLDGVIAMEPTPSHRPVLPLLFYRADLGWAW